MRRLIFSFGLILFGISPAMAMSESDPCGLRPVDNQPKTHSLYIGPKGSRCEGMLVVGDKDFRDSANRLVDIHNLIKRTARQGELGTATNFIFDFDPETGNIGPKGSLTGGQIQVFSVGLAEGAGRLFTGNVTGMSWVLHSRQAFNADIGYWDVSRVTNFSRAFNNAKAFNQDLSSWDTRNVTRTDRMFSGASAFNGDITTWDMSRVNTAEQMFRNAGKFDQDISGWDVRGINNLNWFLDRATGFKQDLTEWYSRTKYSKANQPKGFFHNRDSAKNVPPKGTLFEDNPGKQACGVSNESLDLVVSQFGAQPRVSGDYQFLVRSTNGSAISTINPPYVSVNGQVLGSGRAPEFVGSRMFKRNGQVLRIRMPDDFSAEDGFTLSFAPGAITPACDASQGSGVSANLTNVAFTSEQGGSTAQKTVKAPNCQLESENFAAVLWLGSCQN